MPDDKSAVSLPWYARLAARVFQGKIRAFFDNKVFHGRPGLLRTVVALSFVALVVLPELHLTQAADVVNAVCNWIGLAAGAAGIPGDHQALADAIKAFVAATVSLIAVLRPVIRWILGKADLVAAASSAGGK